jgi:hypothetical protein
VKSHVNERFRRGFAALPDRIKTRARQAYRQFMDSPSHPSLEFKPLPPHSDIWSVRITSQYRAVGQRSGDAITWFFIGSHAQYDALLARL